MTHPEQILLVRHGEYDDTTGNLTDRGRQDILDIASNLGEKNLGRNALLLSSDAPRAWQSAELINASLELETSVVSSPRIRVSSQSQTIHGVGSLDRLIEHALRDQEIDRHAGQSLIVVSHLPLVATAAGKDVDEFSEGTIVDYKPGSWQNRYYSPHSGLRRLNEALTHAGLTIYED